MTNEATQLAAPSIYAEIGVRLQLRVSLRSLFDARDLEDFERAVDRALRDWEREEELTAR